MDSQQGRHGGLPQAKSTRSLHVLNYSGRACAKNAKSPPAGRWALQDSAVVRLTAHAFARDARNVGVQYAKIGKLTVGKQVELTLCGIVAVPALETVGKEVEHCLSPMD